MGKMWTLAGKDIRILLRDRWSLFWVIIFPLLFALFFGAIFSGAGGQMSGMRIIVVDEDNSPFSRSFITELDSLPATRLTEMPRDSAFQKVRQGKAAAAVVLKKGFGQSRGVFGDSAKIELGIDPARKVESSYIRGMLTQTIFTLLQRQYLSPDSLRAELNRLTGGGWGNLDSTQQRAGKQFLGGLADFMGTIKPDTTGGDSSAAAKKSGELIPIDVVSVTDDAEKPQSGFEIFFPSALLWSMMACAASFGISIVKERTAGTFMRLQLSPIRRSHILAGKGLACFVTCVVDCVALLVIGKVAFGIRVGDPINLALALIAASLGFVGIMMLISVLGKTEESVGGAGWGILMVIAMLGGAMVPSYVMPNWLQTIGVISPVKWGILAFEGAGWRNFSLAEMMLPVSILLAIAVAGYSMGAAIFSRSDR